MYIANLEPYSPEWVTKHGAPHAIWLRAYNDPKKDFIIPWDLSRVIDEKLPLREYPLTEEQCDELIAQGYEFLPLKDSYR
jgi:hypothetical protein